MLTGGRGGRLLRTRMTPSSPLAHARRSLSPYCLDGAATALYISISSCAWPKQAAAHECGTRTGSND